MQRRAHIKARGFGRGCYFCLQLAYKQMQSGLY